MTAEECDSRERALALPTDAAAHGLPTFVLRHTYHPRHAHSALYVAATASAAGLEVMLHNVSTMRLEWALPVRSHVFLLRKSGSTPMAA